MLKHKVGDTVRIQTQEWIDAQEKLVGGSIEAGRLPFIPEMWKLAGRIARVTEVESNCYKIDLDAGFHNWTEEMFDSDYDPLAPLSAEDAIRAMLDGETLYDGEGNLFKFIEKKSGFIWVDGVGTKHEGVNYFGYLYRLPAKRKRHWSQWEILAWAGSEESHGWLVQYTGCGNWSPPQYYNYADLPEQYQRARLLPDHSGIDENTIQGFEVEE